MRDDMSRGRCCGVSLFSSYCIGGNIGIVLSAHFEEHIADLALYVVSCFSIDSISSLE